MRQNNEYRNTKLDDLVIKGSDKGRSRCMQSMTHTV